MLRFAVAGCLAALILTASSVGASEPPAKMPAVDFHGDPLPAGAKTRLGTVRYRRLGLEFAVMGTIHRFRGFSQRVNSECQRRASFQICEHPRNLRILPGPVS